MPLPYPIRIERRADGCTLILPQGEIAPHPPRLTDWLVRSAAEAPERTFVARRGTAGDWFRVSYREALAQVRALGGALLERPVSRERPIAILSGNGIEHLLLGLAAMYVGVPYVPVSTSYSLAAGDLARLRYVLDLLTPGMVAVFGGGDFSRAVAAASHGGAQLVTDATAAAALGGTRFETLIRHGGGAAADAAHARQGGDSIAKYLLTSGSTGHPKAVIMTQRMLCSNQAMIHQAMPFLRDEPPVLVDWLPWNHVFGGCHNVGIVLANGGTLYIDDGRPTPAGIEETVRNLREISPTVYFNVPKGFEALLPYLESDAVLRRSLFKRLRAQFFAGAGLSQHVWDGLDRLAIAETGATIPMLSGLGATETGPSVTFTTPEMGRSGAIGLPVAGNIVKLAPVDGKLEMRIRGVNVTPGYWRQPQLSAAAFDEEGYYRLGDAVRFVDEADPERGLQFDGRIAEDFKLSSGTWVSVGPLRAALLAALAPLVQDLAVAGLDRDRLGALLFVDPAACRAAIEGLAPDATLAQIAAHPVLAAEIRRRLEAFAVRNPRSSTRIGRARLLATPPSIEAGEMTDKGGLNQRTVLKTRSADVDALYAAAPPADVLVIG